MERDDLNYSGVGDHGQTTEQPQPRFFPGTREVAASLLRVLKGEEKYPYHITGISRTLVAIPPILVACGAATQNSLFYEVAGLVTLAYLTAPLAASLDLNRSW